MRGRPVLLTLAAVCAVAATTVLPGFGSAGAARDSRVVRDIAFPVDGKVAYRDDFGECRGTGCSRRHEGNDLIGPRMLPLVAAADGVVDWMVVDDGTSRTANSGNALSVKDAEGWRYVYVHLNNDTPGTDDNANLAEYRFAPGIAKGVTVTRGQLLGWLGDSGNAEQTTPHLHFEVIAPTKTPISPYLSLRAAQGHEVGAAIYSTCAASTNPALGKQAAGTWGYRVIMSDGKIVSFGQAKAMRDAKAKGPVATAATPDGNGYWVVTADGTVAAGGTAPVLKGRNATGDPIVAMVSSKSGKGFWLVSASGALSAHGDAPALAAAAVPAPVVAATASGSGSGMWLLSTNGGVTPLGDAPALAAPALTGGTPEAIAATTTGKGYWVLTSTGEVLRAGDAADYGSLSREGLCTPLTAASIAATTTGAGYLVVATDGSVWAYGDARWSSDLPDRKITGRTALGIAALPHASTTAASTTSTK